MGGKSRLVMDMATAAEFHDKLTEFSEHYSALGKSFNFISGIVFDSFFLRLVPWPLLLMLTFLAISGLHYDMVEL